MQGFLQTRMAWACSNMVVQHQGVCVHERSNVVVRHFGSFMIILDIGLL